MSLQPPNKLVDLQTALHAKAKAAPAYRFYTFCRQYSRRKEKAGKSYLGPRPAIKKIRALCRGISEMTDRQTSLREVSAQVAYLNRKLTGWANYFCLGPAVRVYGIVMNHARRWLCAKHKVRSRKYARYPNDYLHDQLHLVRLGVKAKSVP